VRVIANVRWQHIERMPHVSKIVTASDKHAALDKARLKVRDENPKLNYRKIWAWTIRRLY